MQRSRRENGMTYGRDENGRFVAGNRGGPGRPPRSGEQQYLLALHVGPFAAESYDNRVNEPALSSSRETLAPPGRCPVRTGHSDSFVPRVPPCKDRDVSLEILPARAEFARPIRL